MRPPVSLMAQPHVRQRLQHLLPNLGLFRARHLERKRYILKDRPVFQESKVLKHDPERAAEFRDVALPRRRSAESADGDRPLFRKKVEIDQSEQGDRKSTRLNSSHIPLSRMPSSA